MKTFRNPTDVHPPIAGYTHQIEIAGPEHLLVISGQLGRLEDGTLPEDPAQQFEIALENVLRNLHAAHMSVQDLVKLTFYLSTHIDPARRRAILQAKLKDFQPCMTLIYVSALASPLYHVEIDAWASHASA